MISSCIYFLVHTHFLTSDILSNINANYLNVCTKMFNLIYNPNNKSTYNFIEINLIHNIQPENKYEINKKKYFLYDFMKNN